MQRVGTVMINTNNTEEKVRQKPAKPGAVRASRILEFYEALGMTPRKRNPNPYKILSAQDCTVFEMYGEGLAIKEIAWQLDKPDHFVRNALERIKAKLGIFSKTELALYYHRQRKYK